MILEEVNVKSLIFRAFYVIVIVKTRLTRVTVVAESTTNSNTSSAEKEVVQPVNVESFDFCAEDNVGLAEAQIDVVVGKLV